MLHQLSLMLLKWKEGRQLPESAVDEIANDLIEFLGTFKEELSAVESSELECLSTQYGREKYWKSHFDYVRPVTIQSAVPSATQDEAVTLSYQYVPILEVLQLLSKHNKVCSTYNSECPPALLRDVTDGELFKTHPFFRETSVLASPDSEVPQKMDKIILQLYFDEFEVCNPIGSKRGKHKVLAGYFSVLNQSYMFRSKVNDKHLLMLAKSSVVSKLGLSKLMEPVVRDLNKLAGDGIHIDGKKVRGAVLCVSGDNLSSHQIGGFRECFSSGLMCRFCMADRADINDHWEEKYFVHRTTSMHERHLSFVEDDPGVANAYGVSGRSCLSELCFLIPLRACRLT